jgi:transposase-like protein
MSALMDEEIKRWTARRKTALVLEIIQGKTTIAEASRAYDLPPRRSNPWLRTARSSPCHKPSRQRRMTRRRHELRTELPINTV